MNFHFLVLALFSASPVAFAVTPEAKAPPRTALDRPNVAVILLNLNEPMGK